MAGNRLLDPADNLAYGFRHLPKLGSTDAQIITLERYDRFYGICDHRTPLPGQPDRPWALVELHPAEDLSRTHPLIDTVRTFHRARMKELFGLSLSEYLELPHYAIEILAELADEFNRESSHDANDLLRQLGKR